MSEINYNRPGWEEQAQPRRLSQSLHPRRSGYGWFGVFRFQHGGQKGYLIVVCGQISVAFATQSPNPTRRQDWTHYVCITTTNETPASNIVEAAYYLSNFPRAAHQLGLRRCLVGVVGRVQGQVSIHEKNTVGLVLDGEEGQATAGTGEVSAMHDQCRVENNCAIITQSLQQLSKKSSGMSYPPTEIYRIVAGSLHEN